MLNGIWIFLVVGSLVAAAFSGHVGDVTAASVEWAKRSGDPDAWKAWWEDPDAESYYFIGKDNVVFHALI